MTLTDYAIAGPPDMTAADFARVLAAAQSPALAESDAIHAALVAGGVRPSVWLAFGTVESQLGKVGIVAKYATKNMGNVRAPEVAGAATIVQTERGPFAKYPTWAAGARDWAARLRGPKYAGRGLTTVRQVLPVYAPSGDSNDPDAYIRAALANIETWTQGQAAQAAKGGTMQQFADRIMELLPARSGTNNRPGTPLVSADAFVFHETDNENRGAGVQNTFDYISGKYNGGVRPEASFHFCTDGVSPSAQFMPAGPHDAERCWAIGDTEGGSARSVSGEICVNPDGDYNQAVIQMCVIAAKWLRAHGKTPIKNVTVRYHGSYWSPQSSAVHKGCPRHILAGDWGWTWDKVYQRVVAEYNKIGGGNVDQSQKIAGAVTPSKPDGYMMPGQADSFVWPDGEGVITYRKVRYYNPQEGKWYEREWDANSGFTPWQQVA